MSAEKTFLPPLLSLDDMKTKSFLLSEKSWTMNLLELCHKAFCSELVIPSKSKLFFFPGEWLLKEIWSEQEANVSLTTHRNGMKKTQNQMKIYKFMSTQPCRAGFLIQEALSVSFVASDEKRRDGASNSMQIKSTHARTHLANLSSPSRSYLFMD